MSKPLPSKNYLQIAKELKRLGVIDYDLRRELNSHQKANITRKYHAMRDILKNPEDYAFKSVSDHVKKEARHLGFVTTKKFVIVEKSGYDDVRIETRKKKHGRKETTIVKTMPGKKEKTKLIHGERLLDALNNFKGDLPPGQFMTVRIGKNAPFKRRFAGAKELHAFATSVSFKLDGKLIEQMSIVSFTAQPGKKEKREKRGKKKEGSKKTGGHRFRD